MTMTTAAWNGLVHPPTWYGDDEDGVDDDTSLPAGVAMRSGVMLSMSFDSSPCPLAFNVLTRSTSSLSSLSPSSSILFVSDRAKSCSQCESALLAAMVEFRSDSSSGLSHFLDGVKHSIILNVFRSIEEKIVSFGCSVLLAPIQFSAASA